MAKIEKPQAVARLDEIMEAADALMVARGDLGVELPLEKVPGVQKQITRAARRSGKPVVVATQMLESMIASPVPTRAEVSDVATAVFEGADAIMLSAESAAGQYPVEAVATMDRIAQEVERDPTYRSVIQAQRAEPEATGADAISAAARQIAETLDLSAIICWTFSGSTALRVARERPQPPVVAISPNIATGPQIVAGLGRALRGRRGRPRSGRHGGARLPHRLLRRLRQSRPSRDHRGRRTARHAGRHQHAAHRLCRRRSEPGRRLGRLPAFSRQKFRCVRLNPPDRTAYPAGYGLAPWGAEPWCIGVVFVERGDGHRHTGCALFRARARREARRTGDRQRRLQERHPAAQSAERRRGYCRGAQTHGL